jgi:hypothetical protein
MKAMFEKITWKFRYARYMHRKTRCGWGFGWYCAGVHIDDSPEDWRETDPEDAAYDEISFWEAE